MHWELQGKPPTVRDLIEFLKTKNPNDVIVIRAYDSDDKEFSAAGEIVKFEYSMKSGYQTSIGDVNVLRLDIFLD